MPDDRNGYDLWTDRCQRSPYFLWHDACGPADYLAVARGRDLPYTLDGFRDPNQGAGNGTWPTAGVTARPGAGAM